MKRAAEEKTKLTLPKQPSTPCTSILDYIMLIFGEKKIGKTTLLSHYPGAFFFMFEPGGKAVSLFQRPVTSWADFKQYIRLFAKSDFRVGILDTMDIAFRMCQTYVCKKLAIDHPSDEQWGKGFDLVRSEFMLTMNELLGTGKGIVIVSHATEKEVRTRRGGKYDRIVPTMPNAARDMIEGLVDIWAYYTYDGKDRVLIVQGDDHIGAGHRLEKHFKYPDGSPIEQIPMGTSSKEAYDNLTAAFNNRLQKGGGVERPKSRVKIAKKSLPHGGKIR